MAYDFEKMRREEWPVLEKMTFLDAACVSFAPQRAVRAVKAFADMTATQEEANSSAHHIAMDSLRHKAYEEAAKLLNADPEEIALVESTSHGLNIAAQGIPLEDGDNIITTNLEFIQVALPCALCARRRTSRSGFARPRTNALPPRTSPPSATTAPGSLSCPPWSGATAGRPT